jgi:hypothetical protein
MDEITMSQKTQELKEDIQKTLSTMRALRDEVRVKLHLAGMDAKDEWKKLEPMLADVERTATDFTQATRTAASEAVKKLSKLLSSL